MELGHLVGLAREVFRSADVFLAVEPHLLDVGVFTRVLRVLGDALAVIGQHLFMRRRISAVFSRFLLVVLGAVTVFLSGLRGFYFLPRLMPGMILRRRRVIESRDSQNKQRRHYGDSSRFGDDVVHVFSSFGIRLFVASFRTSRVLLRRLCQRLIEGLGSRAATEFSQSLSVTPTNGSSAASAFSTFDNCS